MHRRRKLVCKPKPKPKPKPRRVVHYVAMSLKAFCRKFCLCPPPPKPKVRFVMALDVSTNKRFHLLAKTDPPLSVIDLQDVVPVFTSSNPAAASVGPDDAEPPNALRCTVTTIGAGEAQVMISDADADKDPGELRILSATFDLHITEAVIEPQSLTLEVDGPIEDV